MDTEIKAFTDEIDAIVFTTHDKGLFKRANYFKFNGTETFLTIKISRTSPPFFGVDKRVIDFANSQDDKFYLVLLVSDKSGWVYSKKEVSSNIKNGFWKLAHDNNYKINNGDLSDANYFTSHNIFLNKVSQRGGRGDIITP